MESYVTANLANYAISLVQQGTGSTYYEGTFPAAIVAGAYGISAKGQVGGSPAESDPTIGMQPDYEWNGTATFPLADLVTSGQFSQIGPIRLARGVQILNFPFKLVSSTDHVSPVTGASVSGQISRDAASFGVLQSGAFAEIGLGWYSLKALTSGDLLANTVALSFSAAGADNRDFGIITQKTSGVN